MGHSFEDVVYYGLEINCSSFVKSLDNVDLYIGGKKRGVLTIDDGKYLDRLSIVQDIDEFYNELIDSFISDLVPYIVYEEDDDLDDEEDDSEDDDSSENDESIDSEEIKKNQKDYEKSLVKSLEELKKDIPMFIKDTQSIKYSYEVDFGGEAMIN